MKLLTLVAMILANCMAHAAELDNVSTDFKFIVGGDEIAGHVVLTDYPGGAPETVALSDNTGAVQTPASVTVPTSSRLTQFKCTTSAVNAPATRTITATLRSVSKTAYFTLLPVPKLSVFELDQTNVVGGELIGYRIGLTGPAYAPWVSVKLTPNSSSISPGNQNILTGNTQASGTLATYQVGGVYTRTVTASFAGQTISKSITLHPQPKLLAFKTSFATIHAAEPFQSDKPIRIEFEIAETDVPLTRGFAPSIRCTDPSISFDYLSTPTKRFGWVSLWMNLGDMPYTGPAKPITFEASLGGITKSITVLLVPVPT